VGVGGGGGGGWVGGGGGGGLWGLVGGGGGGGWWVVPGLERGFVGWWVCCGRLRWVGVGCGCWGWGEVGGSVDAWGVAQRLLRKNKEEGERDEAILVSSSEIPKDRRSSGRGRRKGKRTTERREGQG